MNFQKKSCYWKRRLALRYDNKNITNLPFLVVPKENQVGIFQRMGRIKYCRILRKMGETFFQKYIGGQKFGKQFYKIWSNYLYDLKAELWICGVVFQKLCCWEKSEDRGGDIGRVAKF